MVTNCHQLKLKSSDGKYYLTVIISYYIIYYLSIYIIIHTIKDIYWVHWICYLLWFYHYKLLLIFAGCYIKFIFCLFWQVFVSHNHHLPLVLHPSLLLLIMILKKLQKLPKTYYSYFNRVNGSRVKSISQHIIPHLKFTCSLQI